MKTRTFKSLSLIVCLGVIPSIFAMEAKKDTQATQPFTIEKTTVPLKTSPWTTFLKKNWVPLVGFTGFTGYCLYDRQAIPEFFSWSKNLWNSIPKLAKGLCVTGGALGSLYTLRSLFSKKPLCNNPEHNKYVTVEMFARYKNILDQQLLMAQMFQGNPEQLLQMFQGSDENASGLPTSQQLGDLFNSNKENKTRITNETPPIDPVD